MILIQDGSQPPNIDKPLRIIGDPYKVQVVWLLEEVISWKCFPTHLPYELCIHCACFALQQAKEMVNEILRERDHAGFGERNEYGSRMGGGGGNSGGGGGIEVSLQLCYEIVL